MNPVRRFIASKRKSRYFQQQKIGEQTKRETFIDGIIDKQKLCLFCIVTAEAGQGM
jgi:hypothetical protein